MFSGETMQQCPVLDSQFQPAVLAVREFQAAAMSEGNAVPVRIALEQPGGAVFHSELLVFPEGHAEAAANVRQLERLVKFLLWSRGGFRIYVDGPAALAELLSQRMAPS